MSSLINQEKLSQQTTDIQYLNDLLQNKLKPDQVRDCLAAIINQLDSGPTRIRQLIKIDRDRTCREYSILVSIAEALEIIYKIFWLHNHKTIDSVVI